MTNIREKTALLDKLTLSNIIIKDFKDFDKLVRKEIIEVSPTQIQYITSSKKMFKRLLIDNDNLIDKMVAGSKVMGNKRIDYCNLSTTIKNSELGNLNCYTVNEYQEQLQKIKNHLETKYGIIADFSNVTVKELEINRTFRLSHNFETYHRVLNLIMTNLPSYMKNQMDYKKINKGSSEYQTYYATSKTTNKSKRYLLFKIYNKSKAIENIILLTDSYMRVEFKIVSAEKIKKSLGTNKFLDLTDNSINNYFNSQIHKMIIQPFQNWKINRDKYIIKLMQEQRIQDVRHWQTNVLRILQNEEIAQKRPIILDIEEIILLVNKLDIKNNRKSDIKRNFRKQSIKYENVFCNRDDLKMNEILEKLVAKDDNKLPRIGGIPKTA